MLHQETFSWLYPKSTGDPGRDRNAQTLQFACLLLGVAVGTLAISNCISHEPTDVNGILFVAMGASFIAALVSRMGKTAWAARTVFVAVLMTASVLVITAHDGFRSHAMLAFPGLLLISVMLMDRVSYFTNAGIVLLVVAGLGLADEYGFTEAIPGVRTSTSNNSIFSVDLILLTIALIGGRIARDAQTNISHLRDSLRQLAASEQKFAAAFRSSPAAMSIIESDRGDRIIDLNERFEEKTGYSRSELVGRRALELNLWTEPVEHAEAWKQFRADGRLRDFEFHFRKKNGETRIGLISAEPIEIDNQRCAIACTIDITERKRAEAALRESEERFRKIFEDGPLACPCREEFSLSEGQQNALRNGGVLRI